MADKKLHSIVKIDDTEYEIIAAKVAQSLNVKVEGSDLVTYDGSSSKILNIKGGGSTTVTAAADGTITINSTGSTGGTGSGNYLGAVTGYASLSTAAKEGDFYRVSAPFDIPFASGSERAHAGDILIAIKNSPTDISGWDLLHTDTGVTGVQQNGNGNAFTSAGYSAATGVLTLTKGTTFATISHGTSDPTENINTQYYFKY